MRVIINHLTRMAQGFFCVAGIDVDSGKHIRPVVVGRLPIRWLSRYGGPFDIGHLVDIGKVVDVGHPPEVEDRRFEPRAAVCEGVLSADDYLRWLEYVSRDSLRDIFGDELRMRGARSCGVDVSRGTASLGSLIDARADLYLKPRPGKPPQVRLSLRDGTMNLDLAITDIRLHGMDHTSPDVTVIERVAKRLRREKAIISVGLGRPYPPEDPLHWLQANNIHFVDDPCWRIG